MGGSVLIALLSGGASAFAAGSLELVSRADPSNLSATPAGQSRFSSLSADGRYVVFLSDAVNVVADQKDANGGTDVFLRDQVAGATVLVSHASDSASSAGNAASSEGQISADGRYVLFGSTATNLVTGQIDQPDTFDLFLYDRVTGTTALASRSSASPHQTGNGSKAPFDSALSADGRWVAFTSSATNLVSGQADTNGKTDVFLYDRTAGTTTLVSRSAGFSTKAGNDESSGAGLFSISADGGQILFLSLATDLVPGGTIRENAGQLFLFNRLSGAITLVSHRFDAPAAGVIFGAEEAAISADGNYLAFVSQGGSLVPDVPGFGKRHLYLYQRTSGAVTRVTRTENLGHSEKPRLSADGRYVAFISDARDLAPGQNVQESRDNVFLYDRAAGTVTLVSRSLTSVRQFPVGQSRPLSISADGRFVAYESEYTDLVPGQIDTSGEETTEDAFLFDRAAGTSRLVSHAAGSSTRAVGDIQYSLAVSANGRYVGFSSYVSAIVAGERDLNRALDALLYDPSTDSSAIISLREGTPSVTSGGFSKVQAISADGRYLLFGSDAPNLVPGQRDVNDDNDAIPHNDHFDVFLYDRVSKAKALVSHSTASPATTGNRPSQAQALSADGRWAVFYSTATDLVPGQSDDNGGADIFLYDRTNGAITLVSHSAASPSTTGDGAAYYGANISADGRFVAFYGKAGNWVPGQVDGNSMGDVFLFDRVTGATQLVSHAAGSPTTAADIGAHLEDLSADGRFVTFTSYSTNLVAGQVATGPFVNLNVFLFDRVSGATVLVSHVPASPTTPGKNDAQSSRVSGDGRFVAFETSGTDLDPEGRPGIFLFDRLSSNLIHVGFGSVLGISADGRIVAFSSPDPHVIPGQVDSSNSSDIFLYDRVSGVTTLASRGATPTTTLNSYSLEGVLSADGGTLAFWTSATDAVPGFLSLHPPPANVFLFHQVPGTVMLVSGSLGSPTRSGNGNSYTGAISANGRFVALASDATDLVPETLSSYRDIYHRDVYLYSLDGTPTGGPVPLPPCALFNGALRSNARKILAVAGSCGVPAGAKQVAVKITVSQGTGKGNVQLYPGNVTNPASGILRFTRRATRSDGFTVPLGNGAVALLPFVAGNGMVRVAVEVDGYTP